MYLNKLQRLFLPRDVEHKIDELENRINNLEEIEYQKQINYLIKKVSKNTKIDFIKNYYAFFGYRYSLVIKWKTFEFKTRQGVIDKLKEIDSII